MFVQCISLTSLHAGGDKQIKAVKFSAGSRITASTARLSDYVGREEEKVRVRATKMI